MVAIFSYPDDMVPARHCGLNYRTMIISSSYPRGWLMLTAVVNSRQATNLASPWTHYCNLPACWRRRTC